MTNIICLLYVGWVTNYIASVYVRGQEPAPDKKLEEDKGDTLKIIERLDHLENVIKQHIQEEDVVLNRLAEVVMGIPDKIQGPTASLMRVLFSSDFSLMGREDTDRTKLYRGQSSPRQTSYPVPSHSLAHWVCGSVGCDEEQRGGTNPRLWGKFLPSQCVQLALFTQEESHSLALSIPEYAQEKIEGEWKDIFPGVNNSSSNKSAIARRTLQESRKEPLALLLLALGQTSPFEGAEGSSCIWNQPILGVFRSSNVEDSLGEQRLRVGATELKSLNLSNGMNGFASFSPQGNETEAPAKPEEAEAEPFTDSSLFAHWGQELSPEGRRVALKQFQYYGYNAYLSDRLPLDRPLPDLRPSGCRNLSFPDSLPEVSIVFIFVNEALSVLLRSIHSAIERTPPHLLKEIILVDDYSSNAAFLKACDIDSESSLAKLQGMLGPLRQVKLPSRSSETRAQECKRVLPHGCAVNENEEELKEKLTEYVDKVNGQKPGFIKVVRHSKQEGLIRSRVSGWRAATAPVVALFDAHVEFNVGWAEPVLTRIKENRKRIISPSFDNIKYDNFEIEEYPLAAQGFDWELWCRYLNPPKAWWKLENSTAPIRSPALIGCFIVDRQYFQEIGLLDEGMEVYGGENVELGIRVWQCGGSVEVLPCSRIAHIERAHKPYTEDLTAHVRRNALRVAEVWMDEFKSHVYMAWNIPQETKQDGYGAKAHMGKRPLSSQDSGIDIGDITARKALRKQLQCKTFRWYLVSVYPEMRMYSDIIAYGVLQNSLKTDLCLDQGPETENVPIVYICHGMTPQ
ncbi:hypothetical protein MJT46_010078, partial [Ovis ammon polii x Ovis aries]